MTFSDLLPQIATHPQVCALQHALTAGTPSLIHAEGLHGSAAPAMLAALTACKRPVNRPFLIVLNDEEEAGYFYHDLTQMLGEETALFYPPPIGAQ